MKRVRKFRWLSAKDGTVLVTLLALALVLTILIGHAGPSLARVDDGAPAPAAVRIETCTAGRIPPV